MVGINSSDAWVTVFQQLSTRIASGAALDSAYIPTEGMLLFESKGILEPLNSYMTRDRATVDQYVSDIDPALWAKFKALDDINGYTYVLPIGYNVATIWYNRQVFKEFNVSDPSPDWTWEQFEAAAQKISSPPNRYGFYLGDACPKRLQRHLPLGPHQRGRYPSAAPPRRRPRQAARQPSKRLLLQEGSCKSS